VTHVDQLFQVDLEQLALRVLKLVSWTHQFSQLFRQFSTADEYIIALSMNVCR